ncbi:MAG: adenosylcobinamide-phosphate synthase CbiB [Hyphomicrobiales bacterium]
MSLFLFSSLNVWTALLALLVERFTGYPKALLKAIGHPVMWMGVLITWLENRLNNHTRRNGVLALLIVLAVTLCVTLPIAIFLRSLPFGWVFEALFATTLLAQKDLRDHVKAVRDGLRESLDAGRKEVAKIVGRDPQQLDETGVTKGAIESLAENTSDGVIAPLFWLLIAGLPGIALYKAVNTCDSMIGYKSERYQSFGWASARFDDVLNFVPARLTGVLFGLASGSKFGQAFSTMRRDAPHHVSPNAGWPEAAIAGGVGIALGGPRSYDGRRVDLAWMGKGGRENLDADDIGAALRLYGKSLNLTAIAVALIGLGLIVA